MGMGIGSESQGKIFPVNQTSYCQNIIQLSLSMVVFGIGMKGVREQRIQRKIKNFGMKNLKTTLREIKEIIVT
jgi:hypothetical protein